MAVLLNASSAVTVNVIALPAVALAGALTTKCVAAAALTVTAPLVPVIELVTVSVAVIVWLPRRLQRDAERARAAGQRGVGRQDCRGVAAGEVDRAGVARGRVVVGVFGRDGER